MWVSCPTVEASDLQERALEAHTFSGKWELAQQVLTEANSVDLNSQENAFNNNRNRNNTTTKDDEV